MSFKWVVLENSWEYNDEYMYRPESEGGKPAAVFDTPEEANEECRLRNIAEGRDRLVGLCRWGNNPKLGEWIHECCEPDADTLAEIGVEFEDHYEAELPVDISDENLEKAMNAFDITFYEVHKVPYGGKSF